MRVELLVNSWVGGPGGGREGREQWTVLLCAGVGGGREREREIEREGESQADDRVKEVSVYAGK